jgi:hypothetical protein
MRYGKKPIGKIPVQSPAAGSYSGNASKFYVMKVVYVDEDGKEMDQPPPCWYVMEDGSPPIVRKVFPSAEEANAYAYAQALRDQYDPG